ncbi:Bug family tripartite tricarboxylate transporter substrate binding protein [Ramlibacter sp. MAHUQ-53]|uniref:Bug family tripartite tricarboxylate transporter substrate binding protein n=1 Tax=unclassified Ramlibacter TaxID=2617605 RepID=UPI00363A7799
MNPSNLPSRRRLLGAFTALAAATLAPAALAQGDWPAGRPVTWVVPYPAAGSTDVMGRAIAQRLAASLGATVVVDNKPGATGTIGGAFVAKANPDGLTVLHTTIGAQAIAPHLMGKLPYEPLRDLEPVALVGTIPHLLVVAPAQPFKSVADLLAAGKAKPGEIAFASGGNGTILQMQAELLAQRTGVKFIHVPYKGDTPALQDTLGGQVQFMFAPVAAALPHVKAGKLRALAVTSAARLKQLPEVPTMAEAGQKDFVVEQWQAVYLPARTPAPVVQRLNAEINKALREPAITELADKLGVTLVGGAPKALADTQAADSATWARVIRTGNIKAD